jgi:GT2 family glycosyltransferase
MTQVILNTNTLFKGSQLKIGDIVELDERTCGRWIRYGIAHEVQAEVKKFVPVINLPIRFTAPTSIIMLSKDCLDFTKKCLDSLAAYTKNFELIIVDNGSDDKTIDYLKSLKKFKDLKLVLNGKNVGVPYGWNQGVKLAKYDYMAIINNDVIFTPNWLYHLQKCFDDMTDCSVASPTTCYSSGLQCDWKLEPKRFDMSQADMNSYAANLEFGYVDTKVYGFAFLTHKKVIDKIGVFDYKRYGMGSAEEADFFWRSKQVGFKVYWVKHSYIHHYGHMTYKKGNTGINLNQLRLASRKKFDDRVKNDPNLFIENDVEVKAIEVNPEFSKAIDVIIPTLDRSEETIKTLEALFEHNKNINVIIVDNGSSDLSYLDKFKVTLIKNDSNVGIIKALNTGLETAKSKYVVTMHNDVVIDTPDWICKAVKFMDANDNVGIVGISGWTQLDEHGSYTLKNILTSLDNYNKKPDDFAEVAVTDGQCNVIRNIGLAYDESYGLTHFYDMDICMQYRNLGYRIFVTNVSADHLSDRSFTKEARTSTTASDKYKTIIGKKDNDYRLERNKIFLSKWGGLLPLKLNEPVPILMTTYNRLPYTKRALEALLENTIEPCKVFIFDNNSTDGTQEYLKSIKDKRVTIYLNDKNEGIIKPKNIFLEEHKDSKYVSFVDNDCIMPKGWLTALIRVMDSFPLFAVQSEHYVGLGWDFKNNAAWFKNLYHINFNGNLYLNNFIGGGGTLVRRSCITEPIPELKGTLRGWVNYVHDRFDKDNLVCAFYDGVFMQLCDMEGTNKKIYEFDDYKKELADLGRNDFGSHKFTSKDILYYEKLRNKIDGIVKGWK